MINIIRTQGYRSFGKPGNIIGCDFVGEVVKIGDNVPKDEVEIGELRSGLVSGSSSPEVGAFAE